eukprot:7306272-Alexandrium_andersonii.AAC.1
MFPERSNGLRLTQSSRYGFRVYCPRNTARCWRRPVDTVLLIDMQSAQPDGRLNKTQMTGA